MGSFWQDLRYAVRMLRKSPGFTAVAVFTLALGIGANAAIFSVVNSVLLRPLPFKNPGRLVKVTGEFRSLDQRTEGISISEIDDLRRQTQLFEGVSAPFQINANLTGSDQPARVEVVLTTADYFSILGVDAALGRVFGPQDSVPGIGTVAVLSDGAWRRRFGADPNIIGKQLRIDNDLYTVIGVMPPNFQHPAPPLLTGAEVWAPAGFEATPFPSPPVREARFFLGAICRLRPGITLAEAQSRLDSLSNALRQQYPNAYPAVQGWNLHAIPLQRDLTGDVRPALIVLLAVVGFVLLIACVNVANLLLARAAARQGEIAVRLALGAARYRLIRQLLVESLLLSFLGGVLGLAFASGSLDALVRLMPPDLPQLQAIQIDRDVLGFAFGICTLTAVLFGLVPALSASNPDIQETLRQSRSRTTLSASRHRAGAALVVVEFAMALMLLIGAVLLVRSFWNIATVSPGFRSDRIQTASIWLYSPNDPTTGNYYTAKPKEVFYRAVLERLRNLPGVEQAAAVDALPLSGGRFKFGFKIQGRPGNFGDLGTTRWCFATPEFFHLMSIPLLRGRGFSESDNLPSQRVTVINEAFARAFFSSRDPIGQQIQVPPGVFSFDRTYMPWYTVVGVVGNIKDDTLDASDSPMAYSPFLQDPQFNGTFLLRTRPGFRDSAVLVDSLTREIHAVDPQIPVFAVRTMDELVTRALSGRRFSMLLLVLFAGLALVLSAVGIYGVMKYFVNQRTHEMGIRMALGAQPRDILRQVFRFGATMALSGVAIGLAAALLVTRWLAGLLYGVRSTDPVTFIAAPILLTLVALLACYLPARRAMRVDPIVVLRYE